MIYILFIIIISSGGNVTVVHTQEFVGGIACETVSTQLKDYLKLNAPAGQQAIFCVPK